MIKKIFNPCAQDLAELNDKFWCFAASEIPGLPHEINDKHFVFLVHHGESLVAGISGSVYWDGLEINTLWVDEELRGQQFGRELLQEAEAYAREQGAVIAFLKTVGAKGFYEKQGYAVFGVLEDRPIGTVLYHMKKRLD